MTKTRIVWHACTKKKTLIWARESLEIKRNDDNRYDFLTIVIVFINWYQLSFLLLYTRFNFEAKNPPVIACNSA